jgi:hypothetical protein
MYFSLYHSLIEKIPKKDLTKSEKLDLLSKIEQLDSDGKENLFVLIKYHYLTKEKGLLFDIPYEGKLNSADIEFDISNFPKELKQILYKFVKLHFNKMKEDELRKE